MAEQQTVHIFPLFNNKAGNLECILTFENENNKTTRVFLTPEEMKNLKIYFDYYNRVDEALLHNPCGVEHGDDTHLVEWVNVEPDDAGGYKVVSFAEDKLTPLH